AAANTTGFSPPDDNNDELSASRIFKESLPGIRLGALFGGIAGLGVSLVVSRGNPRATILLQSTLASVSGAALGAIFGAVGKASQYVASVG
nr:hypothetical protein [Chlamydiota bacterium]